LAEGRGARRLPQSMPARRPAHNGASQAATEAAQRSQEGWGLSSSMARPTMAPAEPAAVQNGGG
jgi:hypothetical protein